MQASGREGALSTSPDSRASPAGHSKRHFRLGAWSGWRRLCPGREFPRPVFCGFKEEKLTVLYGAKETNSGLDASKMGVDFLLSNKYTFRT